MGLPADARRALRDAFGEPEEAPSRPKSPSQLLREVENRARKLRRGGKSELTQPAPPPAPNGVKILEWVRTGLELGIIPEAALREKLRELFTDAVAPKPAEESALSTSSRPSSS